MVGDSCSEAGSSGIRVGQRCGQRIGQPANVSRGLAAGCSNHERFARRGGEATLFEPDQLARRRSLCRAVDRIRDRWGHAAVITGESAALLGRLERNDYGFILRTPSLTK